MDRQQALKLLTLRQHRVTRAREVILEAIFKIKGPFTAFDILASLNKKKSTVDLVTIYRNLPVLEEIGVICRSDFSDQIARYMVAEPGHDHHHHHIVCTQCQKVAAVDFCTVQGEEKILENLGFRNITHRLEFSGICAECAKS